ncbi:bifunctional NAD(P)/FAD-dependent oxidoreductase/class I SAM-dependent methyltransferase [Tsukamurella sp. PLM1]|uniref:bifunctional NAD(P)/FAD-dependent oxidoreductase/class I SAM-dependent methyltransferase n=1 Tax=Tsukamurella sp. PLM1 TaxID=2929795 RepID=UPI002051905F|nr:bifunctional NAD(P)/FAD-dependent oxidoreductase/class I SAM-dependent methyltransferase [Tsukamurella sp. PLM1]BDH55088.1 methyltransferase [Tsukamurella sp. PLM1]
MNLIERHCDVCVIGGSVAGLAAALQLGRQRRSVLVVDAGEPRNAPAEHLHSFLGFDGAPPAELLRRGREDVRAYGGEVLSTQAERVTRTADGFRVELAGGHAILARRVLAATGLADELPPVDGLAAHWGRDVLHCPFCHGYEVRDRRVVQLVDAPLGLHPTPLLRRLTDRLTVVLGDPALEDDERVPALRAGGVTVVSGPARRIVTGVNVAGDSAVTGVELADGTVLPADAVVVAPRVRARAEAFAELGLHPEPHPSGFGDVVTVDPRGATGVPGLYAAGSLTDPSQQLLAAAAQGSTVGAMISFDLAEEDLAADARPSANRRDWDNRYDGERMWSGNPNGTLVREITGLAPGRALDVGAGEGGDAVWLAEQGWAVTASDVSARALEHVATAAAQRGAAVATLLADAGALDPFPTGAFDLVSAQYASIPRSPDQRAVLNLLEAVAPDGTLLVVGHDPEAMRAVAATGEHAQAFDPDAYVSVDHVAAAVTESDQWVIEVHEKRARPHGAVSTHHIEDVVLRARRVRG